MAEPRRSTRKPKPVQREQPAVEPAHVPAKRKAKEDAHADPAEKLAFLLQNPKSRLTKIDLSDLINASSWNMLSPESQTHLAALLPPTAFRSFRPTLEAKHPAAGDVMNIDLDTKRSTELVDPALFTDAHFLAASRTFQDHIYSNWLSNAHIEKVKKYEQGVRDGTLAAPWKDEVWEHDNQLEEPTSRAPSSLSTHISSARAGEAADIKLVDLVKGNVLREGDVLAYKRSFTVAGIVIEKDVIIQRVDPRTHGITVLLEPGPTRDLPAPLLQPGPAEPSEPTRSMTVTSPSQLESGLLDVDGRVERARRPHGNAWKALTVWRWTGDSLLEDPDSARRGGRQEQGTLFYLRACHYQDR